MSVYTVKKVLDRKEWSGNFGPMVTYVMNVEDEEGSFSPKVELNRKPESREPQEGERFAGHLEETNFAEKLKVDFEATKELSQGSRSSRPSESSTGSKSSKGDTDWDAIGAEKRRCHSQEMALRMLAIEKVDGERVTVVLDDLWNLVDAFDQDVIDAGKHHGQKASQGAASTTSSPQVSSPPQGAAPDSFSAEDTHAWMENLLIQGGTSTYGAGKLASYALEKLHPDALKKCEALLANLDTIGEGTKRLETSYEKAEGEPVPQQEPLDPEIPF